MTVTPIVDRVATANIYSGLTADQAEAAVRAVLRTGDVAAIGLQEWRRSRDRILARFYGFDFRRPVTGGGPIGLNHGRYHHVRTRGIVLAAPGRVDRSPGRRRFLGASIATLVIADDQLTGDRVAFVNYHLTAEVQRGDGYRHDRPLRVARHRREVRRLEALIARLEAAGLTVYALGDSNFHGLRLAGVTSAWAGRAPRGTHKGGKRAIDDVHGPGPADDVELVATDSDHDAVVATRRR